MCNGGECRSLVLALLFGLTASLSAAQVGVGEDAEAARDAYGKPLGVMETETGEVWIYRAGSVWLEDGKVTRVAMRTPEELRAEEAQRQKEAAQREELAQAQRARLLENARKVKTRKLGDPDFLRSPANEQYAFWRDFARDFPEIEVGEELLSLDALEEARLARIEREAAARKAVAEARQAAAEAERAARRAEAERDAFRESAAEEHVFRYGMVYPRPPTYREPTFKFGYSDGKWNIAVTSGGGYDPGSGVYHPPRRPVIIVPPSK